MSSAEVEYRILGPLEAVIAGRSAALGGRVQRTLLAVLLLHPNEPVSAGRLVDLVWGEAAPASASHAVSVYISKLRQVLGYETIGRTRAGYVLRVAPGRLDLERFETLVWQARQELASDEPGRACDLLDEALALWRGPPLDDTQFEDFARADVARLEELRLAAITARAEAKLALGRALEIIPELEALTTENPHDERVAGLLILALYRIGRQSDALARYQCTRSSLSKELGIEPSQSLRELERRILAQDPSLSLEPSDAVPTRSIIALPRRLDQLAALAELAGALGRSRNPHEVILAWIEAPGPADRVSAALAEAIDVLARSRAQLVARGGRARVAAFTAPDRAADILRLATRSEVDLLALGVYLSELDGGRFDQELTRVLVAAPCDVALWIDRSEGPTVTPDGPIVVPFGALEHDWAALELAAWLAATTKRQLVLLGAAPTRANGVGRDASRMLADAGLLIQHVSGVVSESRIVEPGRAGLLDAIGAGALVISGVSDRWSTEGLGKTRLVLARSARSPVVFVRRGKRPGGLSPPESLTLHRWSMTSAAR